MEQLLETIWQDFILKVSGNIDGMYLCTFMMLSYLIKKHFGEMLERMTRSRWKLVYTVLIIATVLAFPFTYFTEATWVQIFFTYLLGTSLHEVIFGFVEKKIKQ
jgi:hypothetical protein